VHYRISEVSVDKAELEGAWPAQEPPRGFAERVLARSADAAEVEAPTRARRPWRRFGVRLGVAVTLAASVVLWRAAPRDVRGEIRAEERVEARVGRNARAVLEAGAHLAFSGERVRQDRGDVFYRVEPSARFVVETTVGEVEVLGTCFRVLIEEPEDIDVSKKQLLGMSAGAALGAVAVVVVYEGRVQLSQAGEVVAIGAGEVGQLDERGAQRLEAGAAALEAAQLRARDPSRALVNVRSQDEEALRQGIAAANEKLQALEAERGSLAERLGRAQAELARRSGGEPRGRDEFDLDQEDWRELAAKGTVKYRLPCQYDGGWTPSADQLDALGLAPDDAETIRGAYERSRQRVWNVVSRLCEDAGGAPEMVDSISTDTCTHIVMDVARSKDMASAKAALHAVAEVRAGLREPPAEPHHPVYDLFYTLSGEAQALEADLAESFGPEEAKRITFSKQVCAGSNTYGMQ
jgi:hypothetical protein